MQSRRVSGSPWVLSWRLIIWKDTCSAKAWACQSAKDGQVRPLLGEFHLLLSKAALQAVIARGAWAKLIKTQKGLVLVIFWGHHGFHGTLDFTSVFLKQHLPVLEQCRHGAVLLSSVDTDSSLPCFISACSENKRPTAEPWPRKSGVYRRPRVTLTRN